MSKQLLPLPPFPLSLTYAHSYTDTHTHINTDCRTATCRADKQTHSRSLQVTHAPGELRYHFSAATLTLPPPQCPATLLPAGLGALRHTAGRTLLLLLFLATDFSSNCIQSQLRLCKGTWHLCTSPPALHPHPAPACIPLARCPARDAGDVYLFIS